MPQSPLNIGDHLPGRGLVPAPVQLLCGDPELDNKIPRQIFRLDLAALLPPQPNERLLVAPHYDPGVRTADKGSPVGGSFPHGIFHIFLPAG
jgi:hypothetical protein